MSDEFGGNHYADFAEQMRSIQGCIDEMSRKLDSMYVMQRIDDDILRKSANSINVIVRLLAGCCRLENQDLWNTLIVSGALLDNVRPSMDLGYDHIPMNNSKLQQLKFILQDLTKVLESPENTDAANSTPNTNSVNNIPSTSTQNKMHSVSPISSTFSSEDPSTSDIASNTDMAEDTYYINYDNNLIKKLNVSTVVESQEIENVQAASKIQSSSESDMLPDSSLTDDIELDNHNDNLITSDRPFIHNNTATIIESSNTDMAENTDYINYDNNLIKKLKVSTVIESQETENAPAVSQIQSTSGSKMFPNSCLTGIERVNSDVNSTFLGMTPIHAQLSMTHPAASRRIVESEEACALRRKYKNKYRYIDNYKNMNKNHHPVMSDIKKVTSNASNRNQVETKASMINRCLYEPRLILNKFRMTDPHKAFKKSKASGSNQKNSKRLAKKKNSTKLDNKRKSCNNGAGGSQSAQKSAENRNKNQEQSEKK